MEDLGRARRALLVESGGQALVRWKDCCRPVRGSAASQSVVVLFCVVLPAARVENPRELERRSTFSSTLQSLSTIEDVVSV
eukprot:jgi/Picsp_1/1578/NSC_05056-R1_---NA---